MYILDEINRIFEVKEHFELLEKLENIVHDEKKMLEIQEKLKAIGISKSNDFLRDYYQETFANKKNLKQDFTPKSICEILGKITTPATNSILDVCAGVGGLSISQIRENDNRIFYCEEKTKSATTVLIFNLAFRNVNAIVKQKDVLTEEVNRVFELKKGDNFSRVSEINGYQEQEIEHGLVVSNPPFSAIWQPKEDERFEDYGLAPKSKADYAFVLDVLSHLSKNGRAFIILPHGILFRGGTEKTIRQKLIENNIIETIISLPEKLFLNTDIPVVILILNKNKKDNLVKIINAEKLFEKMKSKNIMKKNQVSKVVYAFFYSGEIKNLSRNVKISEIAENDYNLNIPRYLMIEEEKEKIDIDVIADELIKIEKEIKENELAIVKDLKQLVGADPEFCKAKKKIMAFFGGEKC